MCERSPAHGTARAGRLPASIAVASNESVTVRARHTSVSGPQSRKSRHIDLGLLSLRTERQQWATGRRVSLSDSTPPHQLRNR